MDRRYRSMDLLRAVAILLVILAHSILSYGAPAQIAPLQLGGTGVDLFFVLSGWLLGGLLFKEVEKTGKIDIRKFWIRRWMRTLPAYYAVLVLSIAQRYLTRDNVDFPWEYFVFVQNYDFPLSLLSVSWSLCVEEQFYLLIAPLLGLLAFFERRTTTITLLILLFLPFVFRQLDWYGHIKETHVRLDCCVAGVFLAHIYHQYRAMWLKVAGFAPQLAIGGVSLYILFFVARYFPQLGLKDPDKLVLAVIFGTWVMLANASSRWTERLYVPGTYYIATRSYALYLLHPEVLAILKKFFLGMPFPVYLVLAVVGSLMIAEILYRFVEKPIMDARESFGLSSSRRIQAVQPV